MYIAKSSDSVQRIGADFSDGRAERGWGRPCVDGEEEIDRMCRCDGKDFRMQVEGESVGAACIKAGVVVVVACSALAMEGVVDLGGGGGSGECVVFAPCAEWWGECGVVGGRRDTEAMAGRDPSDGAGESGFWIGSFGDDRDPVACFARCVVGGSDRVESSVDEGVGQDGSGAAGDQFAIELIDKCGTADDGGAQTVSREVVVVHARSCEAFARIDGSGSVVSRHVVFARWSGRCDDRGVEGGVGASQASSVCS